MLKRKTISIWTSRWHQLRRKTYMIMPSLKDLICLILEEMFRWKREHLRLIQRWGLMDSERERGQRLWHKFNQEEVSCTSTVSLCSRPCSCRCKEKEFFCLLSWPSTPACWTSTSESGVVVTLAKPKPSFQLLPKQSRASIWIPERLWSASA